MATLLEINLLPAEERRDATASVEQLHRMPLVWIIVAIVILIPVALAVPVSARQRRLNALQQQVPAGQHGDQDPLDDDLLADDDLADTLTDRFEECRGLGEIGDGGALGRGHGRAGGVRGGESRGLGRGRSDAASICLFRPVRGVAARFS